MRKSSARGRVCGMHKCTNVKTNAAAPFCAAHEQEMEKSPQPVEKWIGSINLGAKSDQSLKQQLNDGDVTEIEDLLEMPLDEVTSLELNNKVMRKFHDALHKLGNQNVPRPERRAALCARLVHVRVARAAHRGRR